MRVEPYRRTPTAPTVAWLDVDGRAVSEHGELLDLDRLEPNLRVWTSYDNARQLVNDGQGESLCWLGEEIRWRHRRHDTDGWRSRASDVAVLRLPFPDELERCVAAVAGWRDWLARHGAAPTGTTGSAAWSLLRATLEKPLYTSAGWKGKPERLLLQTLGARVQLGPKGPGTFQGELVHYDLPAAYASELGRLPYGGCWHSVADLNRAGERRTLDWWAQGNRPVFAHATVRVPDGMPFGPLARRPRKRLYGLEQLAFGTTYPTGRITGLWTWQELRAATDTGSTIVRVHDAWVHIAGGDEPLAAWWSAIQEGRQAAGIAGTLAKITGNALWGRFCMDGRRTASNRTIRTRERGRITQRPHPVAGGIPPAHDLAETVSGRTRARLYRVMDAAGADLISAHTDGAWLRRPLDDTAGVLDGWRVKDRGRRLDVLNAQTIRWWPRPAQPWEPGYVISGVPPGMAAKAFSERWARRRAELDRKHNPTPKLGDTEQWTKRHAHH